MIIFYRLVRLCVFAVFFSSNLAHALQLKDAGFEKLLVYSPIGAENLYLRNGELTGSILPLLENYLQSLNLEYEIIIVPWSRAYSLVMSNPNSMLLNLDRTKSRENKFIWALPLRINNNDLIGLKASNNDFSLQQIIQSNVKAVCVLRSSQCKLLRDIGFQDHQIIESSSFHNTKIYELILNKKADFFVYDFEKVKEIAGAEVDITKVLQIYKRLNPSNSYLAAPINANPIIKEAIFNNRKNSNEVLNEEEAEVIIYPGHAILEDKKKTSNVIVNLELEKVKHLLNNANIKFFIKYLPWQRTLKEVDSKPNALVLNLSKTEERIAKYKWINLGGGSATLDVMLYGRKDFNELDLDKNEILNSGYTAICELGKAECDLLKNFGFQDDDILQIPGTENPVLLEQMILRSRGDFIIGVENNLKQNLIYLDRSPDDLVPLAKISEIDVFTAMGSKTDPDLYQKIKSILELRGE